MNKILITLALVAAILTPKALAETDSKIKLYEKDSSWDIVKEGAYANFKYSSEGEGFEYKVSPRGLEAKTSYTLINYTDPWPGTGLVCLGTKTSNKSGNFNLSSTHGFDSFTNMKFWVVLSDDVDCDGQEMTKWNPSEYLFENETVSYTKTEKEEEVQEIAEVKESTPSNTFSEDKRCHNRKPLDVTWSVYENNILTWSAVGGDMVEVRMSYDGVNYPFSFVTSNDGHETVGTGTTAGYWLGKWSMRTINGCKTGNWSTFSGHGSW